jgi:hypothetical protein
VIYKGDVGTRMRAAVVGDAFDYLGAEAAGYQEAARGLRVQPD